MIATYVFAVLTLAVLLAGIRVLQLSSRELDGVIRSLKDIIRGLRIRKLEPGMGFHLADDEVIKFLPGEEVTDLVAPRIAQLNHTLELLAEWRAWAVREVGHLTRRETHLDSRTASSPTCRTRLSDADRIGRVEDLRRDLAMMTDVARVIAEVIAAQATMVRIGPEASAE